MPNTTPSQAPFLGAQWALVDIGRRLEWRWIGMPRQAQPPAQEGKEE